MTGITDMTPAVETFHVDESDRHVEDALRILEEGGSPTVALVHVMAGLVEEQRATRVMLSDVLDRIADAGYDIVERQPPHPDANPARQ